MRAKLVYGVVFLAAVTLIVGVLYVARLPTDFQTFNVRGDHVEGSINVHREGPVTKAVFDGRIRGGQAGEKFFLFGREGQTDFPQWYQFECTIRTYGSGGDAYVHCTSEHGNLYRREDAIALTNENGVYFGLVELVEFQPE